MRKCAVAISILVTCYWSISSFKPGFTQVAAAKNLNEFQPGPVLAYPELPLTVTLRAASSDTIPFKTQNGRVIDGAVPHSYEMPHLVLRRNGILTSPDDRTLIIEITGIQLPSPGVTLTLLVETQHGDPDLGGGEAFRFPVWRQSRWIANPAEDIQTGVTSSFAITFEGGLISRGEHIQTPTDYFRYEISVANSTVSDAAPLVVLSQDYAFLMENQWIAPLPQVMEISPGAAPDHLVITYCDMFPVGGGQVVPAPSLRRAEVAPFVHDQLAPALVEAFRIQTVEWGFPWYPEWSSFRDKTFGRQLSVALISGKLWYHGRAPSRGHGGITLQVDGSTSAAYDNLLDSLTSSFHHELFHNLQRNLSQHLGGTANIAGLDEAWAFFTEGTAVLASAVGQPTTHFESDAASRSYFSFANAFLGGGGLLTNLNSSYQQLSPYRSAIYWRFLYEQCGGITGGIEVQANGMSVIRNALSVLYSREIVDITKSTSLVDHLPAIMDEALARTRTCPFTSYRDSLIRFALTLYTLRLSGGCCSKSGDPIRYGLYDPHNLYARPRADLIKYEGMPISYGASDQMYPASIRSSFGIDFVDVTLHPSVEGRPLSVRFAGTPGAAAEFQLILLKLRQPSPEGEMINAASPEQFDEVSMEGPLIYSIPNVDLKAYNRLGLVILRVDSAESEDPNGVYVIQIDEKAF